jgi:hypothetical protein
VQKLAEKFIPVADQVERLRLTGEAEGLFFRTLAEQQAAGGGKLPGQGTYAATPSGLLLGSGNFFWKNPSDAVAMLEKAQEKWALLPAAERAAKAGVDSRRAERRQTPYPSDGLVLRVNSRELREKGLPQGLSGGHWRNADNAWFRKEEAVKFLPTTFRKGAKTDVSRDLVDRLACFHFVDNVTGLPYPFPKEAVEKAGLRVEVLEVKDGRVSLRLEGETRTSLSPCAQAPKGHGYEAKLLGRAVYDPASGRFTLFELVAVGSRWGALRHSERILFDDLDPAPLGFACVLAGDTPAERLAPLFLDAYGWR